MKDLDQQLLTAIEQRTTSEVERLLKEESANPKAVTDDGEPLMNVAARLDNVPAMEALRRHGGDIHAFDRKKNSPLLAAAAAGSANAAEWLLAQGALPNVRNGDGETALHLAAENRRRNIVDLFTREAKYMLDFRTPDGRTAMMMAAAKNDAQSVDALIKGGADAKAVDERGLMAIDFAETSNSLDAEEILAGYGAGNPMRYGLNFDFDAPAAATFKPHHPKAPGT